MAITILPQSDTAWGNIGKQAGQGVSSGLQALANMKMQEYTNKQMYKQQQEAQEQQYRQAEAALDSIGQGQYKPFVRIPGGMKLMQSLALGGWDPQAQQAGQPGSIQQTMNTLQPDQDMGQYLGFNPKPLPSIASFMGAQQPGMEQGQQAQVPGVAPSPTGIQPTADLGQALRQAAMNKPEIVARGQEKEKDRALKEKLAEKKLGHVEKEVRIKEAAPFIDTVTNQHRAWQEEKADLNRMLHITKGGKVMDPKLSALMKRYGLDIGGLQNADTQELSKLAAKRLRGVKEISPKATNIDVQAYEKTIPGLMNTAEGRERLIKEYLEMGEYLDNVYKITQQRLKTKDYEQPFFKQRVYDDIDKLYPEFLEKYTKGGKSFAKGDKFESDDDLKYLAPGTKVKKNGVLGVWDGSQWAPA